MKKYARIISALLVAVLTLLTLAACSGASTPDGCVKAMLKALKKSDFETAESYMGDGFRFVEEGEELTAYEKLLYDALFGDIKYKVKSVSEEGDKATVVLDYTSVDMEKVMKDYLSEVVAIALSEDIESENTEKRLRDILVSLIVNETKSAKSEIEFTLDKVEDKWYINGSDALLDALMGGMSAKMEEVFSVLQPEE